MKHLYHHRPFKIRNADEFDLSQIISLFINPLEGLTSPFDFENSIIKGRMGSGKTMYLRANYAYYLYDMVPRLINNEECILPVFIRLSDFQHLNEPDEIYSAIIIKIVEEISSTYLKLQDAKHLAKIHLGVQTLPESLLSTEKMNKHMSHLLKLGSDEYVERVTTELGLEGGVNPKFFDFSSKYKREKLVEIKKKANPGIKDIEECYITLLEPYDGKILLLVDEAGALDKKFFREREKNVSFFEILMNQLRTAPYLRNKVAIYPNSYQDILTETRYGDVVILEEHISDQDGYNSFRRKTIDLIENYINPSTYKECDREIKAEELFEISKQILYGDSIEQLINASSGNMRRMIQLLDSAMESAYSNHKGEGKVLKDHVIVSLKNHSVEIEGLYTDLERELLHNIVKACKSRSTFKFQFPYMSPILNKYTGKSQEYNIINVLEVGTGRRGTIYAFDYSFCVANDIPTHYAAGTEKIYRERSLEKGRWISRVAQISSNIIEQASLSNKIDGELDFIAKESGSGFIIGDNSIPYYFNRDYIIEEDQKKDLHKGRRCRFVPIEREEYRIAQSIELL